MTIQESLSSLFFQYFGKKTTSIIPLPISGSNRRYYRLTNENQTAIGVFNTDLLENQAFVQLSQHFIKNGINVPQIFTQNLKKNTYLQEDLGNFHLIDFITQNRKETNEHFSEELENMYKKVLKNLIKLQLEGHKNLDYSTCYPRPKFDEQSVMWDLNYFKYYFTKLSHYQFNEQALENDFQAFSAFLLNHPFNYFMHRDFQSRNIILKNKEPYFIDFQGGRQGALQYDVASLLFQAKIDIPNDKRESLFDFYKNELKKHLHFDEKQFTEIYYAYVYIRTMQVLGAYGFRGIFEKKTHFIESIPFAIKNLKHLLENHNLPIEIPTLHSIFTQITEDKKWQKQEKNQKHHLTVTIHSFSYKKGGVPSDFTGNGGGFVFDCRALHNPGRYEPYKKQTGRDKPVQEFLQENSRISEFLESVIKVVEPSVEKYLERNFTNLSISFGCTGGQHRSVYSADFLAKYLSEKYPVNIKLIHREQDF